MQIFYHEITTFTDKQDWVLISSISALIFLTSFSIPVPSVMPKLCCYHQLYIPSCLFPRAGAEQIWHWWLLCSSAGWRRPHALPPWDTSVQGLCQSLHSRLLRTGGPWSLPAPLKTKQLQQYLVPIKKRNQKHSDITYSEQLGYHILNTTTSQIIILYIRREEH